MIDKLYREKDFKNSQKLAEKHSKIAYSEILDKILQMRKFFLVIFLLSINSSLAFNWETEKLTDDWDETTRTLIFSDNVTPNKPLSSPYSDPLVYMYWDCDEKDFVMRNTANNFMDSETGDGYNLIKHDVKIDDQIKSITSYQNWNSEYLILDWYNITNLARANNLIIRLNHYKDGYRQYAFDLSKLSIVEGCK